MLQNGYIYTGTECAEAVKGITVDHVHFGTAMVPIVIRLVAFYARELSSSSSHV